MEPSQTKIIYSPIGEFSGNLANFLRVKCQNQFQIRILGMKSTKFPISLAFLRVATEKVGKNPQFVFSNSGLFELDLNIELLIHSVKCALG